MRSILLGFALLWAVGANAEPFRVDIEQPGSADRAVDARQKHRAMGNPAPALLIAGSWMTSHWFPGSIAGAGIAILILSWRRREREHSQRHGELAIAVRERTNELQADRKRERDCNSILEMIVGSKPLGVILDAIGRLACGQTGAAMCSIVLRRGEGQFVGAAIGIPAKWRGALSASGAIPFEAWRKGAIAGAGSDPIWRPFTSLLGGPPPDYVISRLIGNTGSPLGILLALYEHPDTAPRPEQFDTAVRLARIAIEHATVYDDLHRQARHDPLTGLPNRFQLDECLELAIRDSDVSGRKLALLFIDMDRFKEINDTLSHRAGDVYLREIADRMKRSIRPDDIVARIGGDEFNIIVPGIESVSEAEDIASKILDAIREPVAIDGSEVQSSASIGISVYPDDGLESTELQRKADTAMYRAKTYGKNQFQTCGNWSASHDLSRMEYELRLAMSENRLRIHYQAKVGADGRLAGLEALVRIHHPVHGEIGPAQFIPVAEQTGLIVPLGAWVMNEVCRQIAEWARCGLKPATVAVNVSAAQVRRRDFARFVEECLERHGVDPSSIELELTESFLIAGGEAPKRQMEALKRLGVKFSIDDFGVCYSSLNYLQRFNVDAVKLDRSFVQSIESDPHTRRLVKSLIGVADSMGLNVVAEGVETEQQREALVDAGCFFMQGYLFARPQPASEVELLLRHDADESSALAALSSAIAPPGLVAEEASAR